MKVLFLDIDGVVNSRSTTNFKDLYPLDPHMAFMVGKIQLDTGCEVVLSSSWRYHPEAVGVVERRIVKLLDSTSLGSANFYPGGERTRGDEVKEWLEEHPDVTRYAILDDDSDFYPDQPLFQTTFEHGLTEEIARKVTEYLNG